MTLSLNDNEAHWVIVGLAMNTVVVPKLRDFVEYAMKDLYKILLSENPPINKQTYDNCHKSLGTSPLEYTNINGNDQVTARPLKLYFNYDVRDHLDLSRLFLKPFMCHFTTFMDIDASALLTLVLNVDDSSCPNPRLTQKVNNVKVMEDVAERMRDTRNMWAHCSFKEWDAAEFSRSFQTMQDILNLVAPSANRQTLLAELDQLKQNGVNSLAGELSSVARDFIELAQTLALHSLVTQQELVHRMFELEKAIGKMVSVSRLTEVMNRYSELLHEFNMAAIGSVMSAEPLSYDVSKYVQLALYNLEKDSFGHTDDNISGIDEFLKAAKHDSPKTILAEELFQPDVTHGANQKEPRTVVIVGVPGAGKTFMCYHLLEKIYQDKWFPKHAKYPFLIKFRDINLFTNLSVKNLLLRHHGPNITPLDVEEKVIWTELVNHEKEVMIIIDGFDECDGLGINYNLLFEKPYTDLENPQQPQVLLYNLICGRIFRDAKVVLTTRPHCVDRLRRWAHDIRIVNISPLDWQGIEDMVKKELETEPISISSVVEYVKGNEALQGLCSVPINAKRLLDYVRWVHRGQTSLVKDKLPKTMAGLLLVLDIKIFEALDRTLEKAEKLSPIRILEQKLPLVQKLTKLAYNGTVGRSKQRFSEEDLQEVGLEDTELEQSIMTCSRIHVEGDMGLETKNFYSFLHLTQQDHLAGLHMTQIPVKEIEEHANRNQGQHDSLFSMYLGASGDEMVTKYLPHIYPGTEARQYAENCRCVMKTIWQSDRRWKRDWDDREVGELYALSMYLSCAQWDMAQELTPCLYDHHGVWKLPSNMTPAEWTAVNCYLHHLPRPVSCLWTESLSALVDHVHSTNYTGAVFTMEHSEIEALKILIARHKTLTSLMLTSGSEIVWNDWSLGDYRQLHCVRLNTVDPLILKHAPVSLDTLCIPLHMAPQLDTLVISYGFDGDTEMSLTELMPLQTLRHLCIQASRNGSRGHIDVEGMGKFIQQGHLTWLQLYYIQLDDGQATKLADCVSSEKCRLKTLRLQGCGFTETGYKILCEGLMHNASLTALDLSHNETKKILVPHLSGLLKHNSTIRELDISWNIIKDISDLCDVLKTSHSLCVLNLSGNNLSAISKSRLCAALCVNTSLQVLMMNGCGLDDASVDELTASLTNNTHIKVYSLRHNFAITVESVKELISNTHVEILDVRCCKSILSEDSLCRVAEALCRNNSMQVLGLGDEYNATACTSFLAKLCKSYPNCGPLQVLYMPCADEAVRRAGAALAERLNIPHLVRHQAVGYSRYGDLAADTGYRWCSVPPDRRWWLLYDSY